MSGGLELPLSFGQEQLWFLEELAPGKATYNIAVVYQLEGSLDPHWLRGALDWVVGRHDVLRARFGARDGMPFQVIGEPGPVSLPIEDVTHLPGPAREQVALRSAAAQASAPFDLRTGPLYRVRLIRLAADRHLLSIVFHHIVSDGWSVGLFTAELSQAYEALAGGGAPIVSAPHMQYAGFVDAQRAAPHGTRVAPQLAYWERQLSGLPVLDLPADHPRPTLAGHHGAEVVADFAAGLSERLDVLARSHGVSRFMVLAAVVCLVLSRYTGAQDIPIGTTVLGRPEPELEQLIGFFVNMVVLRVNLTENPAFGELLDRVRDVTLEAYDHQDVAFENVVHRLNLPRDPSRNPLFQVCLQVLDQDTGGNKLSLPGVTVSPLNLDIGRSRFDLSLTFTDSPHKLSLSIEYSAELYDAWRMEQLARHVERVLTAVVDDPSLRMSEVQLITDAERAELLRAGYGPHDELRPDPVHVIVAERAVAAPGTVAVVFEGAQLTYGELDRRADLVARHLRSLGVRHEDIVAVAIERGIEVLVAMLGVLKAGGAFVILDTDHPVNRLRAILDDAGVNVVVTRSELLPSLPEPASRQYVCVDRDWPTIASVPADTLLEEWATRDSLVYVLYTSGSTGKPKGVPVEHRALVSYLTSFVEMFSLRPGDRMLQYASLAFDLSQAEIFSALISGATLVFARRDTLLSPEALAALIRAERITYVGAPPAMLALVEPESYPDLRNVLVGGEVCPPDLVNRWNLEGRKFVNGYGPTEATIGCTMYAAPRITWRSSPPIGGPLQHRRLYVVDSWGNLVPTGVPGELLIGGDEGLARGYLNRPELTAERFINDPFWPEGRVYRSGDLVRWTPDLQLEFVGRIDTQVKLRGLRIELEEIESVLAGHPGLSQAAVALCKDAAGQQLLAGYVTIAGDEPPSVTELRAYLGQHVPAYMVPTAWTVLDAMPLSVTGKINRAALSAPASFAGTEREVITPQSLAERHVAAAFAEVLDVPLSRISADDDFFELGGSSLQAMRVLSRINRAFAINLGVRTLYKAPRLRDIAQQVDELATTVPPEPGDPRLTDSQGPASTAEQIAAIIGETLADLVPAGSAPAHASIYDLGADESHAARVMELIAERTGVTLTERSFYTVSVLAAAVEAARGVRPARRAATSAPVAPLVQLAGGNGDDPALLCVPPVSGSPFVYTRLARLLCADRPVYGFEAPGPQYGQAPLNHITDLAAAFVASLRQRRPGGPYHLLGWSMGGLVAFEMTRQLIETGESVDFLAVIDTQLPDGADVPGERELTERFIWDLAETAMLPVPELGPVLDDPDEQRRTARLIELLRGSVLPPDIDQRRVRHQLAVFLASGHAAHTYTPKWTYRGRLTVIRTADALTTGEDWGPLADEVSEHVVPGNHYTIWTPEKLPRLAAPIIAGLSAPARTVQPAISSTAPGTIMR